MSGVWAKLELAIVDLVNPKFNNYTKPLLMAGIILSFTAVIFTILVVAFHNDCPSTPGVEHNVMTRLSFKYLVKLKMVKCLQLVSVMQVLGEGEENMGEFARGTAGLTAEACRPTDVMMNDWGVEWCKSHVDSDGKTQDQSHAHSMEYPNSWPNFPQCPPTTYALMTMVFDRYYCRELSESFADAFAYTAYVEAAITVFIILLFHFLGFSKLKKSSGTVSAAEVSQNPDNGKMQGNPSEGAKSAWNDHKKDPEKGMTLREVSNREHSLDETPKKMMMQPPMRQSPQMQPHEQGMMMPQHQLQQMMMQPQPEMQQQVTMIPQQQQQMMMQPQPQMQQQVTMMPQQQQQPMMQHQPQMQQQVTLTPQQQQPMMQQQMMQQPSLVQGTKQGTKMW